ncbi:MAG: ABC transporter permease [Puniceicoccales bacterium]|jgi:phospholipid/cholesterol/gamma-HCH transport system permease protein|nr:ABC transporter permease [Puniceicoccales bacterium]
MQKSIDSEYLQMHWDAHVLTLQCFGTWPTASASADTEEFDRRFLGFKDIQKIVLDTSQLQGITSSFLLFFKNLQCWTKGHHIALVTENLPESVLRIFKLSQTTESQPPKNSANFSFIYRLGCGTLDFFSNLKKSLSFFLAILAALYQLLFQRPKNFMGNLFPFIQQTGVEALPIVALISALVGLIMAFVSVTQLERFGASIYVADLVSLAMTREMGCLMTGVIMAGRTGAAFAASIGSMQVNEELDALQTFGINKITYLVLPRVVALMLMMPLLCIFSDLIGIIGGMISALPFINCSMTQYLLQMKRALRLNDVSIGLVKSFFFGVIVAGVGCCKGIQCGRNAAAVGNATTAAVVQGITWIIIADAIFAVFLALW